MKIENFPIGMLMTNSYLAYDGDEGYMIDAGGEDLLKIYEFIDKNGIKLKGIIFTHGHYDHIAGLGKLMKKYPDIEIYIGAGDREALRDPYLNLSNLFDGQGLSFDIKEEKLHVVGEGDKIWRFEVYETPGHTPGSISLYSAEDDVVISGDLIFFESYGRTDFPGGDFLTLVESIRKIVNLGDEITIYPGHYKPTSTGEFRRWFENSLKGEF